jgi:hypothetical protein
MLLKCSLCPCSTYGTAKCISGLVLNHSIFNNIVCNKTLGSNRKQKQTTSVEAGTSNDGHSSACYSQYQTHVVAFTVSLCL